MSILSRLFGGGGGGAKTPAAETVEYNGYFITPEPIPEDGGFRLAAKVENAAGQVHHLVRADLIRDRQEAETAALAKARQAIDQMGDGLFD
ncbi:Transcriptional activator HlyU [Roseivivax jejudonensis]|uniref:Transcriptional activator HlyU n=1 Tax=Roseivivax jejudonensis TaxID=1529041 RepID=A0A1X7ABT8_9RHOB|nr:HlyU family transcriptional regulator [Roseivivax jejudonensis]SLN73745.1 Transcriptional activator HlyU [Roseivivax jejudonensis]